MELKTGEQIAATVVKELAPFCDRIEVAGSIRRKRPLVNDVDLVILPKAGMREALRLRCKQHCRVVTDGKMNMMLQMKLMHRTAAGLEPVQLDIFIAEEPGKDLFDRKPTNFGSLFLCRTGSKEHNIFLVEHAKRLGLRWNPYRGVFAGGNETHEGTWLAGETEEEIFKALELEWVEPERRER